MNLSNTCPKKELCKIRDWGNKFNKEQREKVLPSAEELLEDEE